MNFSTSNICKVFGLIILKFNFLKCFTYFYVFSLCHLFLVLQNLVTSTSTWSQPYRATTRRQFLPLFPQEFLLFTDLLHTVNGKGSYFSTESRLFCFKHQIWGFKSFETTQFSPEYTSFWLQHFFSHIMVICLRLFCMFYEVLTSII